MAQQHAGPFFIVIFGPTGVGKTEFSLELANYLPIEIINADMGQLYEPLSIGTAKPAWKSQSIKHHLFDIVNEPTDYSAYTYRQECLRLLSAIADRGKIPVLVGGTGFYVRSLFFAPYSADEKKYDREAHSGPVTWNRLFSIDPERAVSIHPHDTYRIERALRIWQKTRILPSQCKPQLELPGSCFFIFLDRQKEGCATHINERVEKMIERGWLDEVRALSPEWRTFVRRKRLIGYPELLEYVEQDVPLLSLFDSIAAIQKRTRDYARRQRTYWRGLKKSLIAAQAILSYEEIDVSCLSLHQAAKRVCQMLTVSNSLTTALDTRQELCDAQT